MAIGASPRSRSSGSSTSSLSSTFSDLTSSTSTSASASSSSPPHTTKTHAFFASPFSTRPPSPAIATPPPPSAPTLHPPRSLTLDFFSTPVRPPSPPPSHLSTSTNTTHAIHPSRIFPSRYTATVDHSPEFISLDINAGSVSHQRAISSGSESSFTSSFVETRLPTPPPPATSRPLHRDDTIIPLRSLPTASFDESTSNEPTPRLSHLEPTLLHFERSLLLAAQEKQKQQLEPEPEPELEQEEEEEEEPHEGSIISLPSSHLHTSSHLPLSPLSLTFTLSEPSTSYRGQDDCGTPTPTNDSVNDHQADHFAVSFTHAASPPFSVPPSPTRLPESEAHGHPHPESEPVPGPKLRLVRPLGHGAFSAVWLADDLSRVPLTLASRKSVRDLRRRASGRASGREREREVEKMKEKEVPARQEVEAETKVQEEGLGRPLTLREGLRSMFSFSRPPPPNSQPSSSNPIDDHSAFIVGPNASTSTSTELNNHSEPSHLPPSPSQSLRGSVSPNYGGLSRNASLKVPFTNPDEAATLSRDASLKKFRERVRGTRPAFHLGVGRAYLDERHGEMGSRDTERSHSDNASSTLSQLGSSLSRNGSGNGGGGGYGRLVAVKMTPRRVRGAKGRRAREEEERTRVGFVREVEVLKHISHPNITPLLAHLSTASHHILVLPYLPGGDLLGLVNNDVAWGKLSESVLRRIWCELCKAVGWMHGVGLVHRDIKLENILLTTPAFTSLHPSSPPPTLTSLPPPPLPFLKLTDFGLSRFVSIAPNGDAELLSTRCGSEAYAAPELVTGGRGFAYDARGTDAWACGVVLYALVGRRLPFGEGVSVAGAREGEGRRIGGERGGGAGEWSLKERRGWLVSIAKGEYEWPGVEGEDEGGEDSEELVGAGLVKSRGARRVVGRLLVRDPRKRARIGDLWDDVWMSGGDEQSQSQSLKGRDERSPVCEEVQVQADSAMYGEGDLQHHHREDSWVLDGTDASENMRTGIYHEIDGGEEEEEEATEEEEEGGCLLDQEGIDSITRREVV
ncbi:hypothetical protein B0H34DRAFT_671957 [Crassisporium funariophilum]|nr:hypothetical protein B0H34DRAFT_671957 [Crassisporium funariophilum]